MCLYYYFSVIYIYQYFIDLVTNKEPWP